MTLTLSITRLTPVLICLAIWVPIDALAFDCRKAALPSDFVICSSPDLVSENENLAKAWRVARAALDKTVVSDLIEGQKTWLGSVNAACGLPERGKPDDATITGARNCVLNAVRSRTSELKDIGDGARTTTCRENERSIFSCKSKRGAVLVCVSTDLSKTSGYAQIHILNNYGKNILYPLDIHHPRTDFQYSSMSYAKGSGEKIRFSVVVKNCVIIRESNQWDWSGA